MVEVGEVGEVVERDTGRSNWFVDSFVSYRVSTTSLSLAELGQ